MIYCYCTGLYEKSHKIIEMPMRMEQNEITEDVTICNKARQNLSKFALKFRQKVS